MADELKSDMTPDTNVTPSAPGNTTYGTSPYPTTTAMTHVSKALQRYTPLGVGMTAMGDEGGRGLQGGSTINPTSGCRALVIVGSDFLPVRVGLASSTAMDFWTGPGAIVNPATNAGVVFALDFWVTST